MDTVQQEVAIATVAHETLAAHVAEHGLTIEGDETIADLEEAHGYLHASAVAE